MGCSFADRFLALWVFEQLSFDLAGLWSTTALLVASHECFFKKNCEEFSSAPRKHFDPAALATRFGDTAHIFLEQQHVALFSVQSRVSRVVDL